MMTFQWYCPVCKGKKDKAVNVRPNTDTDLPPQRGDCPDCGAELEIQTLTYGK